MPEIKNQNYRELMAEVALEVLTCMKQCHALLAEILATLNKTKP